MSGPPFPRIGFDADLHAGHRGRALLFRFLCGDSRSLLSCFPEYHKALRFDMQLVNTGWATQRTLGPAWIGMTVRYRVHRLVSGDGLFWEFVAGADQRRP